MRDFSRRGQRIRMAVLLSTDLVAMFLSWFVAATIAASMGKAGWEQLFPPATPGGTVFTLMSLAVVISLAASGQYGRRSAFWEETRIVWRQIVTLALINFALNFFLQVSFTRVLALGAWVLALGFLPMGRLVSRELLLWFGLWRRRALVVGSGATSREAESAIRREQHMGLEIIRTVNAAAFGPGALPAAVANGAEEGECEVIVVVLDEHIQPVAARMVLALHAASYEVFVVPALQGLPVQGMQAQHFFSNDVLFLRLQHRLLSPWSRFLKRSFDVVAASALLACVSPLMVFVAWRIWREDGAPVFYTQPRVSAHGSDFALIKFRSMTRDADAALAAWQVTDPDLYERYMAANFKLPDDPRVLRVGSWIRRASIDELPQLWNVLRGDMSLVGPRPLLRRELSKYSGDAMAFYAQVRPGITGLWQVSGRSGTTFEQRAVLDGWYVRNWSLWVDWVILLKTFRVVVSGHGAM